jgi:hypothetical protein
MTGGSAVKLAMAGSPLSPQAGSKTAKRRMATACRPDRIVASLRAFYSNREKPVARSQNSGERQTGTLLLGLVLGLAKDWLFMAERGTDFQLLFSHHVPLTPKNLGLDHVENSFPGVIYHFVMLSHGLCQ